MRVLTTNFVFRKMKKLITGILCLVALSTNAQMGIKDYETAKKKIDLQNEIIFFMKFTRWMGSEEMKQRNVYSVVKYVIDDIIHYKISKDAFYRKDFITMYDDDFDKSKNTIKKKFKGYKIINEKLICLYGHKDLFEIKKKRKVPKRFYATKNETLSDDYQSFSVTLVLNGLGKLDVKRIYMSYDDSENFVAYRNERLRRQNYGRTP